MKTRKRTMEFFSFYDHTGIEAHLSRMAKKGWMIESITNLYWTYRKIEPKDIHFSVSYYPRASDFDPEPTQEQQTFHEFCAHTGWTYICSWFQMQVFCNEAESPVPLDTDPIMEVDTLHRACKKNFLIGHSFLLVLGLVMSVYSLAGIWFVPIDVLSSSNRIVTLLACLMLFALPLVEISSYLTWYHKAKKAAQDGIFVATSSTANFQKTIIAILLVAVVWWFWDMVAAGDSLRIAISAVMFPYTFGIIFLVNFVKQGLKKAKASQGLNRTLTLAVSILLPVVINVAIVFSGIMAVEKGWLSSEPEKQDPIPLTISDFHQVDEAKYIRQHRNNETFMMGHRVVHIYGDWEQEGFHDLPDLQYTVTTVKVPFFYDWSKAQMYRDLDESDDRDIPQGHKLVYREIDGSLWGAREVYQLYLEEGYYLNWYLVCYDDRIIEIRFDWEPTAQDIELVKEKLNP